MGRWKLGPQGGYYDANDSGPDQYTPTPAERASQGGGEQGGYMPPTGGVSGYGGGMNPHPGQPMPSPLETMPAGGGLGTLNGYATQNPNYPAPGQGGAFGGGVSTGPMMPPGAQHASPMGLQQGVFSHFRDYFGSPYGSIPKSSSDGIASGWSSGLGGLNQRAGNMQIGPYGTPR